MPQIMRSYEDMLAVCRQQGVPVQHVLRVGEVGKGHVEWDFNTGKFYGETPEGIPFDFDQCRYDGHAWFDNLLTFFYEETV